MVQSQPQENSLRDPISKKLIIKSAGGVAQGEGPEFKLQYCKKKKKKRARERGNGDSNGE
jgi:hypothetical protein